MTGVDRVTWRLEIPAGWGQRLDPAWLPSGDTEAWRRTFAGEDLAGRCFAAGGAGLPWKDLAWTASQLACTLEQYRMQWRCAEQVALGCPEEAEVHLSAVAVPAGLRPPRRSAAEGPWRVCVLDAGLPAVVAGYGCVDLAEGAAVAHRTLAADRAVWAEPAARVPAPATSAARGWVPVVDTDLRLRAFAAEEAVADLTRAAATGHLGPDVLDVRTLCTAGQAAHHMVREYRTLFRAAWTDLEGCRQAQAHDADAEALLATAPDEPERGPGGSWHHVERTGDRVRVVGRHPSRRAAAASVAAQRATDGTTGDTVRWCEPAGRLRAFPR